MTARTWRDADAARGGVGWGATARELTLCPCPRGRPWSCLCREPGPISLETVFLAGKALAKFTKFDYLPRHFTCPGSLTDTPRRRTHATAMMLLASAVAIAWTWPTPLVALATTRSEFTMLRATSARSACAIIASGGGSESSSSGGGGGGSSSGSGAADSSGGSSGGSSACEESGEWAVVSWREESDAETVVPVVSLTRSRDGSTGTATFSFAGPRVLSLNDVWDNGLITGLWLRDEEGALCGTDLQVGFERGRPNELTAIVVLKSRAEWERFMRFMKRYAAANDLGWTAAEP